MEGILLDTMFELPSLEGVEEVVSPRRSSRHARAALYLADRSDRTARAAASALEILVNRGWGPLA